MLYLYIFYIYLKYKMSPPEIWGPAVWTLFHTLAEKINQDAYPHVIRSMFGIIVRICKVLPCPDCSRDASIFLAKINLNNYKTKNEFKNFMYLFHNWVNAKKRKPLYNYSKLSIYSRLNLIHVINNFTAKYNTKGNMKLLADSFQRGFVVKDLITWFKFYSQAFIQPTIVNSPKQVKEEPNVVEEPDVTEQQDVTEEQDDVNEESDVTQEQDVTEESDVTKEQDDVTEEQDDVTEEQDDVTEEQDDVTEEQDDVTEEPI